MISFQPKGILPEQYAGSDKKEWNGKQSMIRKATRNDLDAVDRLYNELIDAKEAGLIPVIWRRGIYPSRETALEALEREDLFVMEKSGRIIGSAVINQIQDDVYAGAPWHYDVPDDQVCVLHTLMITPAEFGKGYARELLAFYEQYALGHGWPELRIDTNDRNLPAQAMYQKHGYRKICIVPAKVFNGILDVNLVLLEKHLTAEGADR